MLNVLMQSYSLKRRINYLLGLRSLGKGPDQDIGHL
jgi:hypothetical protein